MWKRRRRRKGFWGGIRQTRWEFKNIFDGKIDKIGKVNQECVILHNIFDNFVDFRTRTRASQKVCGRVSPFPFSQYWAPLLYRSMLSVQRTRRRKSPLGLEREGGRRRVYVGIGCDFKLMRGGCQHGENNA